MPKQNILYSRAHILLNPEEGLFKEGWQTDLKDGKLHSKQGLIQMTVGNKHVLEMIGVTIPTYNRYSLSSEKAIVDSARRIAGDLERGLERYKELAKTRVTENNLYFTSQGLYDYSKEDELKGRQLTEWVKYARGLSSSIINGIPKNIKNRERLEIKLTPTLQAIADIDILGARDGQSNTIEGATFAESVNNFLIIYDAVSTHLDWAKQETRNIRNMQRQQRKCSAPDDIKVAELILSNP